MDRIQTLIKAILGGMCIGFGGLLYLSVDNKLVGAFLFAFGLFMILSFGWNLFTGKACYVLEHDLSYFIDVVIIWFGNLIGTATLAYLIRCTRIAAPIATAQSIAEVKLADSPLSIFILAIFCNIMIFIAVEGYKRIPYELGKYLAVFLAVGAFILCSFEHCVANMFYFSLANVWNMYTVYYLLIMTFGNMVGAVIIPVLMKLSDKK
ncbi:MAG: formate/nitrite transporter family protein [Erysipelotrichaceae bacterium]|nr:formate/nitrite transporter family protein [Erysipelotrichaceae bacterium]